MFVRVMLSSKYIVWRSRGNRWAKHLGGTKGVWEDEKVKEP